MLLAALTLLSGISIPAGYYSVSTLAVTLRKQGVSVRCLSDCESDTYAIRAADCSWAELRLALSADHRLTITNRNDEWIIGRDREDLRLQRQALRRYLEIARAQLIASSELPALLKSAPIEQFFGATIHTTLAETPGLASPDGNLRNVQLSFWGLDGGLDLLSDDELAERARTVKIGVTLSIDPLSMAAVCRMTFYGANAVNNWSQSKAALIPIQVTVKPEQVRGESKLKQSFMPKERGERQPWPANLNRPSSLALEWCKNSHQNLLFYVSPFSDEPLIARPTFDLWDILSDANANRFDPSQITVNQRSRSFVEQKPNVAYAPAVKLSCAQVGTFLSIQNERRFIDELVPSGERLNPNFAGRASLTGAEVVSACTSIQWTSPYFDSAFLDFTNPASFLPFALALQKSQHLASEVKQIEPDSEREWNTSDLEPLAIRSFISGILTSGQFSADGMPLQDPLSATMMTRDRGLESPRLKVVRDSSGNYDFQLIARGVTWRSWLRNVKL